MVVPFAIVLATTGAVYLFKPQVEALTEHNINAGAQTGAQALPADDLVASAQGRYPAASFTRLTLARSPADPTVEVELAVAGTPRVLWVNRYTGAILADRAKGMLPMEFVKNIHGNLFAGNGGSLVVELMASWMIVLIVTGVYLWWPRNIAWWRVFLPGLAGLRSRELMRRLHGAAGAWIGGIVLVILLSGLPWTQVWGGAFAKVEHALGWDGPGQQWVAALQSSDPPAPGAAHHHGGGSPDGLKPWATSSDDMGMVTLHSGHPASGTSAVTLQRIVDIVTPQHLANPVEIQPPAGMNGVWSVLSMAQDRRDRQTVHYDRWTGKEIMHIRFADYHPVQRLASYGISLHEGALFGWANQALGVVAALGVILISVSGAIMWWKRRPAGALGVPPVPSDRRLAFGVTLLILVLGVFLPMMGLSLIAVLALDAAWAGVRRLLRLRTAPRR
jgi:uncharacterized iron-regulated membrane protein